MGLISKLLWVVFFCFTTLCFVVLFEHGYKDFPKNVGVEIGNLKKLYETPVARKKDESDKISK